MPEQVRYAQMVWEMMQVLQDAAEPLTSSQVAAAVQERLAPTPYELERVKSGGVRWDVVFGFRSGEATTAGWMTKQGGWALIEGGSEALELFPTPEALFAELQRIGHEVDQRRKHAMQALDDVQQFIAQAIAIVEAGQRTAHEDLAELVGTDAAQVAHFLASFKIQIPNAFRVLNANGTIPIEGMLNANYRGTDLTKRLTLEGVGFDAAGRAEQSQRLTARDLKGLLDELRASGGEMIPTAKRAWMVRGTNIDGYNLVPDWLVDGFVSLSASPLGHLDTGVGFDELQQAVETA